MIEGKNAAPEPLRNGITDPGPTPMRYEEISETWRNIKNRMERQGNSVRDVDNFRVAFAAGVYAASKDVLLNRADSRTLSEAADRIERMR